MNQLLSSLRAELLQAEQQLGDLLDACKGREPLLPGSLYTLKRKCGKPACRCNKGQLHQSTVLSFRGQSSRRNLSPQPKHLLAIRHLTDPYRRCRAARANLVRLQRHILQLVDALIAARVEAGLAAFDSLTSPGVEQTSE
jgi:Family of unknown function (DUF6788)